MEKGVGRRRVKVAPLSVETEIPEKGGGSKSLYRTTMVLPLLHTMLSDCMKGLVSSVIVLTLVGPPGPLVIGPSSFCPYSGPFQSDGPSSRPHPMRIIMARGFTCLSMSSSAMRAHSTPSTLIGATAAAGLVYPRADAKTTSPRQPSSL